MTRTRDRVRGPGDRRHSCRASRGLGTRKLRSYSRPLLLACLGLLVSASLSCRTSDHGTPLRVARGRLALASVRVSGIEGWFLLDTGSSGTIVCPELGSRLRRSSGSHRVSSLSRGGQWLEVGRVRSDEIVFGGSRLRYPEEVSVVDLGFLSDWAGMQVDGILGWDVLREYVWGIDVRGARLVASRGLSSAVILRSFGVSGADATLTLETGGELPLVTVRAGSETFRLGLDTGAERTVVSANAFRRLGLELPPDAEPITTRGVNGPASGHMARLSELRMGPVVWTDLDLVVRDFESSGDQEGLLGMDLLSDHVMVVDGPSRTLYLAKGVAEKR